MSSRSRPRPRARARGAQPAAGAGAVPYLVLCLSVPLACAAWWFGLPGAFVVWLGLLVAAWSWPQPELTGSDLARNPAPNGPREKSKLVRYNHARSLKWGLMVPMHMVWPGKGVQAAWLVGLVAGGGVFLLPHLLVPNQPAWLLGLVDAVAMMVVVTAAAAARRDAVVLGERSPGVTAKSLPALWSEPTDSPWGRLPRPAKFLLPAFLGLVSMFVGYRLATPSTLPGPHHVWWMLVGLFFGVLIGIGREWHRVSLRDWRTDVAARAEWAPSWEMLKQAAPPRLLHREVKGPAVVDEFVADGSLGSATYFPMAEKILQTRGTAQRLAVLPVPQRDSQGQPMPGTVSPLGFKIVSWPNDYVFDFTAMDADAEIAELFLASALAWTCQAYAAQPIVSDLTQLGDPAVEGGQVWMSGLAMPTGPGWLAMRNEVRGSLAATVGCDVLVDHRRPALYVGRLVDGATLVEGAPVSSLELQRLADEDQWNSRWSAVPQVGANHPTVNWPTYDEALLPNGVTVYQLAFTTRQGIDPRSLFDKASALAATMGGAPYVSIVGWPRPERPGERHSQALTVYWALQAPPTSPDRLAPNALPETDGRDGRRPSRPHMAAPAKAQHWVLRGHIAQAFKAARLAQPEVVKVRCLTSAASRGHIWEIHVRLYDGVTLADVRGAAQRLRQHFGSEWLRVAEAKDGCVIYVGVTPSRASIATQRDRDLVTSLDWEQAWLVNKVVGDGGVTPALRATSCLPANEKVQVLDFDLPPGVSLAMVRGLRAKLEATTGNAFVEPRVYPDGNPAKIRMLVCETNPMPERVGFDFGFDFDSSAVMPFATGVEGMPLTIDFKEVPHLLVAGTSGGGKAQPLTTRIPVPVSDRFQSGWATVGDLAVGDRVFTADGSTAPVTALTDIRTEQVYRFTLSDGSVIDAGPEHLWKVSTRDSRARYRGRLLARREAHTDALARQASSLRDQARQSGSNRVAPLLDIARVAGLHETSIHCMDLSLDHLGIAAQVPSRKKARVFDVDSVCRHLDQKIVAGGGGFSFARWMVVRSNVDGLRAAGDAAGGWLTVRGLTDALLGKESDRRERDRMKTLVRRNDFPSKQGLATTTVRVYPVDEVLYLLADRLDSWALGRRDGTLIQPLERVMSSEQLAEIDSYVGLAIRRAQAIDGPEMDLPVDPYVLGAWLGDGSSWHGEISSSTAESCTDEAGLTDQAHLLAQLTEVGYDAGPKPSEPDQTISVRGLLGDLRTLGVLRNKHIPAVYLRASFEQRLAVLQGLMDTDGSIDARGKAELTLCDERLAKDAHELLRTLGVYAALRSSDAVITESDPAHPARTRRRVVGTRWRITFTSDLPAFRLPRKAASVKQDGLRASSQWLYITSIEVRDDRVPMRCIGIDHPSHLYLTEGFIPTHNSVAAQAFIYGALRQGFQVAVVDVQKQAADFRFAADHLWALATDLETAEATMKAIYAEAKRRAALNGQYGVGHVRELPEELRPAPVMVFLDEFLGLIMAGSKPPTRPEEDPELERARRENERIYQAKKQIGFLAGRIAAEARSADIHLVLATQKLIAAMLEDNLKDLKTNMARILLGKANAGERMSALRDAEAAPPLGEIVPKGRGVWESTLEPAVAAQFWFATQDEYGESLRSLMEPLPEGTRLDVSAFRVAAVEDEVPGEIITPGGFSYVEDEPRVVELDEFEFTLDDLELDEGEGDEPAPSVEPLVFPAPGVPAPVPGEGLPAPEPAVSDGVAVEEHVVWDEIDPSGWEPAESAYGWTEVDAFERFLDLYPQVREVSWGDPRLDEAGPDGVPLLVTVRAIASRREVRVHHGGLPAPVPLPMPAQVVEDEWDEPGVVFVQPTGTDDVWDEPMS